MMQEQGLEPPEVAVREGAVVVTFRMATTVTGITIGITTGKMIGKTPGAVLELLRTDPGRVSPPYAGHDLPEESVHQTAERERAAEKQRPATVDAARLPQ